MDAKCWKWFLCWIYYIYYFHIFIKIEKLKFCIFWFLIKSVRNTHCVSNGFSPTIISPCLSAAHSAYLTKHQNFASGSQTVGDRWVANRKRWPVGNIRVHTMLNRHHWHPELTSVGTLQLRTLKTERRIHTPYLRHYSHCGWVSSKIKSILNLLTSTASSEFQQTVYSADMTCGTCAQRRKKLIVYLEFCKLVIQRAHWSPVGKLLNRCESLRDF